MSENENGNEDKPLDTGDGTGLAAAAAAGLKPVVSQYVEREQKLDQDEAIGVAADYLEGSISTVGSCLEIVNQIDAPRLQRHALVQHKPQIVKALSVLKAILDKVRKEPGTGAGTGG